MISLCVQYALNSRSLLPRQLLFLLQKRLFRHEACEVALQPTAQPASQQR